MRQQVTARFPRFVEQRKIVVLLINFVPKRSTFVTWAYKQFLTGSKVIEKCQLNQSRVLIDDSLFNARARKNKH